MLQDTFFYQTTEHHEPEPEPGSGKNKHTKEWNDSKVFTNFMTWLRENNDRVGQ